MSTMGRSYHTRSYYGGGRDTGGYYSDQPYFDRPYSDRHYSERAVTIDRPYTDRAYTIDRPYSERAFDRPYVERPYPDRPYSELGYGGRHDGRYLQRSHSERPIYTTTTSERPILYSDRPHYASERNVYYTSNYATNGYTGAPLPPPTEHSQIIVEHKKPKFGPCAWILVCIFIIFVIIVIICLIIFFTWGKTIQSKVEYDSNHQG